MKNIKLFLIPSVLFLILFSILFVSLTSSKQDYIEPSSFPNFEMSDLNGKTINNDFLFAGEYKIMNIWATWCVNCKLEHGFLMSLKESQIKIIGLNYKDNKLKAKKWLDQYGNPYWISIFDPDGNLGMKLGVSGAPETYLLNKENEIIQKHIGIIDSNIWNKKFKNLIQ